MINDPRQAHSAIRDDLDTCNVFRLLGEYASDGFSWLDFALQIFPVLVVTAAGAVCAAVMYAQGLLLWCVVFGLGACVSFVFGVGSSARTESPPRSMGIIALGISPTWLRVFIAVTGVGDAAMDWPLASFLEGFAFLLSLVHAEILSDCSGCLVMVAIASAVEVGVLAARFSFSLIWGILKKRESEPLPSRRVARISVAVALVVYLASPAYFYLTDIYRIPLAMRTLEGKRYCGFEAVDWVAVDMDGDGSDEALVFYENHLPFLPMNEQRTNVAVLVPGQMEGRYPQSIMLFNFGDYCESIPATRAVKWIRYPKPSFENVGYNCYGPRIQRCGNEPCLVFDCARTGGQQCTEYTYRVRASDREYDMESIRSGTCGE